MVPGNPENERFVPWKGVRIFHLPTIILLEGYVSFQGFPDVLQIFAVENLQRTEIPAGHLLETFTRGRQRCLRPTVAGLCVESCWMIVFNRLREYSVSRLYFCVLRTCEKVMLQFCPFSTTLVAMVPSILPKNVWELVGPRKGRKESRVTQGYTSKGINWQWELLRIPKIIKLPSYISKLDCLPLILSWFPQPKCCWRKPVSILDQADAKVPSRAYCGSPSPICRCLSFSVLRFAFINHPLGDFGGENRFFKKWNNHQQP